MALLTEEALIICTYNRPERLLETLRAIGRCVDLPEYVVISEGVTAEIEPVNMDRIKEALGRPEVSLHHVTPMPHLSRQRNKAVALIADRTRLIHFLDDDAVPSAAYFSGISEHMRRHEECVAAGGLILPMGRSPARMGSAERLFLLNSKKPGRWLRSGFTSEGQARQDLTRKSYTRVEWLSGCSLSTRTRCAIAHPFDEALKKGVCVDNDLDYCIQIGTEGELHTLSAVTVTHYRDDANRDNYDRLELLVRHRYYILQKHRPGLISSLCYSWAVIGKMLAFLRRDFRGFVSVWRGYRARNKNDGDDV